MWTENSNRDTDLNIMAALTTLLISMMQLDQIRQRSRHKFKLTRSCKENTKKTLKENRLHSSTLQMCKELSKRIKNTMPMISLLDLIMALTNFLQMCRVVIATPVNQSHLKRLQVLNIKRKTMTLISTLAIPINSLNNRNNKFRFNKNLCLHNNLQQATLVEIYSICQVMVAIICHQTPRKNKVKMHWISSMILILEPPNKIIHRITLLKSKTNQQLQ